MNETNVRSLEPVLTIFEKSEKSDQVHGVLWGSSKTKKAKPTKTPQKYVKYMEIVIAELRGDSEKILEKSKNPTKSMRFYGVARKPK